MRNEFGGLVCEQFGIYAASSALRDADIGITSRHYLDKKTRAAVGLGKLPLLFFGMLFFLPTLAASLGQLGETGYLSTAPKTVLTDRRAI